MIEYELPGPPYHPVDFLIAKRRHERRMKEIRELDIEEWVESLQEP